MELLSRDELERINETSLRMLAEIGVLLQHDEVRAQVVAAGAQETPRAGVVRMPRELVQDKLAQAPSVVRLASVSGEVVELGARGPTVFWGGNALHIADGKTRRLMRSDDLAKLIRVLDALPHLHAPVATSVDDFPPRTRDFVGFRLLAENSRKHLRPCMYTPLGAQAIYEMAEVVNPRPYREYPIFSLGYTAISPLRWGETALEVFKQSSGKGIPMMVNAEPMAGACAPVTLAGAIAQANAEAMSGFVVTQTLEPGWPCIFNLGFAHPFDMRAAMSLTGSIECGLLAAAGAQLAQLHNLPSASWMSTESATPDAQAALEKTVTGLMHGLAGVNIIWGFGQLDSQQTMSLEMAVIDNELAGQILRAQQGMPVTDETLAYEVIKEVGVGGGFVEHEHTFEHYRGELVYPDLLHRGDREVWERRGARDILEAAQEKVFEILSQEREPLLTDDQQRELNRLQEKWTERVMGV